MRACLTFLLAIMLSLNAAYAASAGICDALEQKQGHAQHIGHHSHEHGDDLNHDGGQVSADGTDKTPVSDHQHNHAHPSFSFIPPHSIGVIPVINHVRMAETPASAIVSAPHTLLDRPPKTILA